MIKRLVLVGCLLGACAPVETGPAGPVGLEGPKGESGSQGPRGPAGVDCEPTPQPVVDPNPVFCGLTDSFSPADYTEAYLTCRNLCGGNNRGHVCTKHEASIIVQVTGSFPSDGWLADLDNDCIGQPCIQPVQLACCRYGY